MKNFLVILILGFLYEGIFAQKKGTFTDPRDGHVYKTVTIGSQTWYAENVKFNVANSWCFKDDSTYCKKYGKLYNYESAKEACPSGWRVPTKDEWDTLISSAGGPDLAPANLSLYRPAFGFNALYGGRRHSSGEYFYLDQFGFYWTSTEVDKYNAWVITLNPNLKTLKINSYDKWAGYSLRCIKEQEGYLK